ncbi:rap guanine nucleotide exchange factor 2 [Nilaparvata lugens]|uniref:rap guanine nucleotide exchange factor 2 n=1 Tax=Nilaparvata lugens TaxID=108931 RepID=UPI00193D8F59|nr:rap guanine nucleotide exchange factor 2 [Nilaparvata lugens]
MFKFAPQLEARDKLLVDEKRCAEAEEAKIKQKKKKEEEDAEEAKRKKSEEEGGSGGGDDSSSPRSRRGRQNLLDPIRRWNSFHNSRDKKSQKSPCAAGLPYTQLRDTSQPPPPPPGLTEKSAQILGTCIANELIALSLTGPKSPARKQASSPNLLDPTVGRRTRRTSSDSCPRDVDLTISKEFSSSDPDVVGPGGAVREGHVRTCSSSGGGPSGVRPLVCPSLRSTTLELSSSLPGEMSLDPSMPRRRFSVCFGKRTGGSARRPNECFVLEPSGMIVIDYPEVQSGGCGGGGRTRTAMDRGVNLVFDESFSTRPELFEKSNRSSHSSDTSSAYSGSDTMTSVHSSVEADEVDLSGLVESIVDSDEEDLAESTDSLMARDAVKECLEKDPSDRTGDDIEVLLEFTQHLKAFTNMTLAVRRALCSVMVFAVVEKAGTIVMNDGEELDSWSVLINGHVEVEHANAHIEHLHIGDSFGILPTMEKLYHRGVMKTRCDDCQFVCITQTDYYRIQNQGKENIRRHEEGGQLVMVTEQREAQEGSRRVVIRGTAEKLMLQLIEENSTIDSTYVEDFLLTHRTFIDNSIYVANQLLKWFSDAGCRDRVTRVVLLWVNNHFTTFETDPHMMDFLERFEALLEEEKMNGQQQLLNIACAAKARSRCVTLARPSRDEVLQFDVVGGYPSYGIFISRVEKRSKAEEVGLKRGDQILEVNGQSFEHVSQARALEILRGTTHLSITVKSNLLAFKEMLQTPDTSPRARTRKTVEIARIQSDPKARLPPPLPPSVQHPLVPPSPSKGGPAPGPQQPPATPHKPSSGFMTIAPKKRLQKTLQKLNILPKNTITDGTSTSSGGSQEEVMVISGPQHGGVGGTPLYNMSHSNPDLTMICYDDVRASEYPEHVLKVYKADQTCKYLLVHKETTAHEVVMLALQEFSITDPSSHFSLCEVSVAEGGIIKQKRLPDQLQNLAERIGLSSRYYLKMNGSTETLVGDELASELVRESQVHFLQLNAVEVAVQLTLQDFSIFRQTTVETTLIFCDLGQCKDCKNFNSMFAIISGLGHNAVSRLRLTWDKLPTKYQRLFSDLQDLMDPSRNMSKYRQLISSEQSQPPIIPFYPVVKKDLTFIHLGNDCRVEGLVNFEKLRMIAKEVRALTNMCSSPYDLLTMLVINGQQPSNALVTMNQLTTGNTGGTCNAATVKRRKKSSATPNTKKMFEEAQMVRRVKAYLNKMRVTTDEDALHALSMQCEGGGGGRGGGSGGGSEGGGSAPNSNPLRKRNPSPTLSTTSSASSASEGRKPAAPKFGSASPQAVRKLLSLSETSKTRPHQPRHPPPPPNPLASPSPSPSSHRRVGGGGSVGTFHERSHSDTPLGGYMSCAAPGDGGVHLHHPHPHHPSSHPFAAPLLPPHLPPAPPLPLSAESSSVTSLSNLPTLRKTMTSGSVTSSDSGHSTQLDSHSNSSVDTAAMGPPSSSPLLQHRRHSVMQPPGYVSTRPPFPHAVAVLPPLPSPGCQLGMGPPPLRGTHPRHPPPAYNVAAQMAARLHRLGRAHSHEGVTSYYHDEDDDEDAQVSAV